jgi:hypothetical protein
MEHQWNEIDREKPPTRRKTCPNATLSTTNPTWTDPESNPGLRSERPATNCLSHGTALWWLLLGEVQEEEVVTLISTVTEQLSFPFSPVCEQNLGDL